MIVTVYAFGSIGARGQAERLATTSSNLENRSHFWLR